MKHPTLTSLETKPVVKDLWERLQNIQQNEHAWAIITAWLSEQEGPIEVEPMQDEA